MAHLKIGRPKGATKVTIAGRVSPAVRREIERLARAQKSTISDLFERTFAPRAKVFSSAEKCAEPA